MFQSYFDGWCFGLVGSRGLGFRAHLNVGLCVVDPLSSEASLRVV